MQRIGQRPNHYSSNRCSTYLKKDGMVNLPMISQIQIDKVLYVGVEEKSGHYVIDIESDKLFIRSKKYKLINNLITGTSIDRSVKFSIEFNGNGSLNKVVLEKGNPIMVVIYE